MIQCTIRINFFSDGDILCLKVTNLRWKIFFSTWGRIFNEVTELGKTLGHKLLRQSSCNMCGECIFDLATERREKRRPKWHQCLEFRCHELPSLLVLRSGRTIFNTDITGSILSGYVRKPNKNHFIVPKNRSNSTGYKTTTSSRLASVANSHSGSSQTSCHTQPTGLTQTQLPKHQLWGSQTDFLTHVVGV